MNFINIKNQIENLNLRYPPIYNKKDHDKYVNDWREQYTGSTISILRPFDTKEVSNIMKFAFENEIPIVPQGGNTGLMRGSNTRQIWKFYNNFIGKNESNSFF